MTRIALAIVLAALMLSIKMNELIVALGHIQVNGTTNVKFAPPEAQP